MKKITLFFGWLMMVGSCCATKNAEIRPVTPPLTAQVGAVVKKGGAKKQGPVTPEKLRSPYERTKKRQAAIKVARDAKSRNLMDEFQYVV